MLLFLLLILNKLLSGRKLRTRKKRARMIMVHNLAEWDVPFSSKRKGIDDGGGREKEGNKARVAPLDTNNVAYSFHLAEAAGQSFQET